MMYILRDTPIGYIVLLSLYVKRCILIFCKPGFSSFLLKLKLKTNVQRSVALLTIYVRKKRTKAQINNWA